MLLGIVLFLASFVVLYMNEGRTDFSKIAKKAVVIEADNVQANIDSEGQLVSASGTVLANGSQIGDDLYLNPGPYLNLDRQVDTYAWIEESETVTKTDSAGNETSETIYSYVMDWDDSPMASEDFNEPEGHTNPAPSLSAVTVKADSGSLEQYSFSSSVDVPPAVKLPLKADMLALTANANLANDTYIFVRNSSTGTYTSPQLGDVRVSYAVLQVPFEGTLFGQLHGTDIEPYVSKQGDELFRVFDGTHDQSIAKMHSEYKSALWAFRLIGFLMMWFGLWSLFGPISTLLTFIPILGSVGKAMIGFLTFSVALLLSGVAIIVFAILHNIFAVIVVCLLILGGLVGSGMMMRKKPTAPNPL